MKLVPRCATLLSVTRVTSVTHPSVNHLNVNHQSVTHLSVTKHSLSGATASAMAISTSSRPLGPEARPAEVEGT